MKKQMFMAIAALVLCAGCANEKKSTNPLLNEYTTPYGIPPFSEITIDNYREAMLKGLDEKRAEMKAIIENTDEPTFENTILAMENCGALLTKAQSAFGAISGTMSTPETRALQKEFSPLMTAFSDSINLNDKLFQKIKKLYDNRENLNLDKEESKMLENSYKRFVRSGANLNEADKATLAKLNGELAALQLQFDQNLMHETNEYYVTVDSLSELEGLPQRNIDAAAKMAKENGQEGKWMFNMQRPSCNPVLQYCKNRELRKKVYDAYVNRCNQGNEYDNKEISRNILKLRLQKAKLMGYNYYAEFSLEDRMSKKAENVYNLLNQVWTPAIEKAKEELNDIRAEIKKEGNNFEPEGWDYMYYLDKAKQAKYSVDENELRPYFEENNVQQGVFYVANKLYGLTIKQRTDLPTYNPDVKSFEVYDKDGTLIALFFSDYYPRNGKGAGAWCSSFKGTRYENGKRVAPFVINVCNFAIPSSDQPALESVDNVETMFHEFGHALNSFFTDVHYRSSARMNRDFSEVPSQINEHWAFEPEVLQVYAKHYQTGEVIPMELLNKLMESKNYGQGFTTVEYVAAALVDMDMHTLTEIPDDFDVMKFEQDKLAERGIPSQIMPRYRVTNFEHCMSGGYTAGYYSYMWAEVYDCDAFQAFKESGDIFNQELATNFRNYILSNGAKEDEMEMYKKFRGKDPEVTGLLKNRGLIK